jgi:hypothetical protein
VRTAILVFIEYMFYGGAMLKLHADAALVVPYLEWLHARGHELLLRPVGEYVAVIRLRQDHADWWEVTDKALRRAYNDADLFDRFAHPVTTYQTFNRGTESELANFRTRLEAQLQVLALAIAGARVQPRAATEPPDRE